MVDTLFDFPQARRVSPDILRRLREVDETATVVHLGGPTWIVGKVRPSDAVRADAINMLDRWTAALLTGTVKMSAQGRSRVQFALLALRGFRPVQLYHITGEPDARIINDFRRSRWLWLHTSDSELFQSMDNVESDKKAANEAALTDRYLAKDVWDYGFKRTHAPGFSNTPKDRVRSGYQRIASIS